MFGQRVAKVITNYCQLLLLNLLISKNIKITIERLRVAGKAFVFHWSKITRYLLGMVRF